MKLWDYVKQAGAIKISNRFSALNIDALSEVPGVSADRFPVAADRFPVNAGRFPVNAG